MAARPSEATVNRATRPGCGRSRRISIDNCCLIDNCCFTRRLSLGSVSQWRSRDSETTELNEMEESPR